MRANTEVLVVGAGPTGLVLALWLKKLGVQPRIIDKAAEPGTTSRALAVQARTLELYAQAGIASEVVAQGRMMAAVDLWVRGKKAARAVFGDLGKGVSPYPYPLIFPQDEHERLLIDRLAEAGVQVERSTELLGLECNDDCVVATVRRPDGTTETCETAYLAGCDGAHSVVREQLGIGFPGGTYSHLFYVADIEGSGEAVNGEINVGLDRADFLAVFPLKQDGHARLVGTVRDDAGQPRESLAWSDVSRNVVDWMRIDVRQVHWFSTYRVHHRVADQFHGGRAFLIGDAAHIHSPVGGQGMNTGIGDAVNIAWKLAAVLRGRATPSLLDTYEPERIAFARRLVATTDRAFTAVSSTSAFARFVRLDIVPVIVPIAFSLPAVRRLLFRTVSQTNVHYRESRLSEGRAGGVHGGDRLPWVPGAAQQPDNFAPLRSMDWQVHVYGEASPELRAWCSARALPLHEFEWRGERGATGIERDAVYLVRPDGYVA
ncbi:MAG TPA: FAD-dependent monooxygenase, partial [Candidatus Eremiobacteraceae bacterium]|nr:FAD-dependent monooxygenase [Candidatus Eremiobacteraceae bacterium]